MASTLWADPYESRGVQRDAQISTIHLAYRLRIRSHIRELYKHPATKAEFQKFQDAYEVLIKKSEVKHSIQAMMGGELQQVRECWNILMRPRGPALSEKMQRDNNPFDGPTMERWSAVFRNSTHSGDLCQRIQPGWLIGIASCMLLCFDLISILLTAIKPSQTRKSHAKNKFSQREINPELLGVTVEKDSKQIDIELPLILEGQHIMATPDLGSDYNVMSASVAEQLKLNVKDRCFYMFLGNIAQLANGHVLTYDKTTSTRFSFPTKGALNLSIEFHVVENLATSVIVGRAFLTKTGTLTTHLDRLVRSPRPFATTLSPPRILHLKKPRRVLRCFINSTPAGANVDTRVDINLASPEFAARCGLRIEPTDQQHQSVQLADGSMASISGCFCARFNAFDKPATKTVRPAAHMQMFYILEGLTSDVLLGRHLLHEMYNFVDQVDQTNIFFDMKRQDLHDDLNVIAWIDAWRNTLALHSDVHDYLNVKHSAFWSSAGPEFLHPWNRSQPILTCLTEADTKVEEEMRQKQEIYLKRRKQAVEANKKRGDAIVGVGQSR
ncbi:hypothetical protein FPOAC2_07241 [Fusarium poae]